MMHYHGKIYWKEKRKRKGCSCVVMDLLGPSLSDLFHNSAVHFSHKRFSLKSTLMLADQLIKRLESLHMKGGYVHRDVKPSNIVMGIGANAHKVYLIDFGVAQVWRNWEGHIKQFAQGFVGTHKYASINTHNKIVQTRRDDLEGVPPSFPSFIHPRLTPSARIHSNFADQRKVAVGRFALLEAQARQTTRGREEKDIGC